MEKNISFLRLLVIVFFSLLSTKVWGQTNIFSENMGTTATNGMAIADYTGFENSSLNFSGSAVLRNTSVSTTYSGASGGINVAFGSFDKEFIISGFSTGGFSNIKLSFGLKTATTTANNTHFKILYSTTGVSGTFIDLPVTISGGSTWTLYTTGVIPSGVNAIKFYRNSVGTSGWDFRLDDVKLTGTLSAGKTVTFNSNYGTATTTTQTSSIAANLTVNSFTRTGYSFSKWNTVSTGGGVDYANQASYDFSADMTLYAQWLINQYNVVYDANGGVGTAPVTQTADYNTNVIVSNNTFTRTGYNFSGWNTAANGTGTNYAEGAIYTIPASNTTMYAQWASTTPSITPSAESVASMSTTYGTASSSLSFTFTGANLTGSQVTATAPAGFEIATTSGGPYASTASYNVTSGGVSGTVFIRLAATADVNNYTGATVTLSDGTTSASKSISTSNVNPKTVTVNGLTGTNKVYDGNISATVTGTAGVSGAVNADVLGLSGTPTATYASKNVGSGVAITVNGYTLTGAKAANYTLTSPVTGLSGNITTKGLTVTGAVAQNREYDTTTNATITGATLVDVITSDVVTVNNNVLGNASFADANVGTAKPVTANLTLGGTDAANYTLSQPTGLTANITATAPIISPSSISMGVGTTANIVSSSSGIMTASSSNIGVASVTTGVNPPLTVTAGATAGTATISVSQAASADGNYSAGTASVTVTVTEEAVGTYRTLTGGTWPSSGTATWERLQAGGVWSTATPSASTTDKLIIRHTITSNANISATGGVGTKMEIAESGNITVTHPSTFSTINIKGGGVFNCAGTGVGFISSGGMLNVDDLGTLKVSTALTNTSTFWRATENFKKGSIVEISDFNGALFNSPSQISVNDAGYFFGNLIFSGNAAITLIGTNALAEFNLTEGDLTVSGTSNNILLASSAKTININGSIKVNAGTLRGSTAASTINVAKDFNLNGGAFNLAPTISSSNKTFIKVNGNLFASAGTTLQSTDPDSEFQFSGANLQTIDSQASTTNAIFVVNEGASVQLTNRDLSLGSGSKFNVLTGGTFDFNLNNVGTSAYKILNASGSVTTAPTFTSNGGSIIKVTSGDGLTRTAALGNVQVSGLRTYNNTAEYQYIGNRTPQSIGDGLQNTGSASALKITINKPNTTDIVNVNTTIKTTDNINIVKGTLVEPDATNSIQGTNGSLTMSADATYKTAVAGVVVPQLSGTYSLSAGSTIELNGGDQVLRGGKDYKNLVFSNGGTKTMTSATTVVDNVSIKNAAIVDVRDGTFMSGTTTLNMTDSAKLVVGAGTDPKPRSGINNLSTGTTIDFANPTTGITTTDVRLTNSNNSPVNYANIIVSGSDVRVNSLTGGLTLQSGGSFHVTNTGVFKVINTNGFSGGTNTAIKNTNTPSIVLDPLATIDYAGASQIITTAQPSTPSDAHYQNLRISGSGVKTASGTTKVNNIVSVVSGELKVAETVDNAAPNALYAKKGLQNNGGVITLANNAVLMQDVDASNIGSIGVERQAHMRKMDYTYWSSPVAGQKLLNNAAVNDGFSVGTPNNRIYYYDEATDYLKAIPTSEMHFVPGKGYAIRGKDGFDPDTETANLFKFGGVPNNGDAFTVTVQKKTATTGGYNLIGNPYPSNLDFVKFFNANSGKISGKAWFWTNVPGAPVQQQGAGYYDNFYATITLTGGTPPTQYSGAVVQNTPTQYVKLGQGFIVEVNNVGLNQTLNFSNDMRSAEAGVFFNDKSNQSDRFWLEMEAPNASINTILLGYVQGATNAYDRNYDAELFGEPTNAFYSFVDQSKMQIQGRQYPLDLEDRVRVGVRQGHVGQYIIRLGNREGAFGTQSIYLRDKLLHKEIDLTKEQYIYTSQVGEFNDRFEIAYQESKILDTDNVKAVGLKVYRNNNDFVGVTDSIIEDIELYDMGGKLLLAKKLNDKTFKVSSEVLANGVYIIKTKTKTQVYINKIRK